MGFLKYGVVGSGGMRSQQCGALGSQRCGAQVHGVLGCGALGLRDAEGAESRGHGIPSLRDPGHTEPGHMGQGHTVSGPQRACARRLWDTRPLQTASARVHVCRGRRCHTPVPALAGPSWACASSWPLWVARAGAWHCPSASTRVCTRACC